MVDKDAQERLARLSRREREVLALFSEGFSYEIIAKTLVISEETVKSHMNHIYEKLGMENWDENSRKKEIFQVYSPELAKAIEVNKDDPTSKVSGASSEGEMTPEKPHKSEEPPTITPTPETQVKTSSSMRPKWLNIILIVIAGILILLGGLRIYEWINGFINPSTPEQISTPVIVYKIVTATPDPSIVLTSTALALIPTTQPMDISTSIPTKIIPTSTTAPTTTPYPSKTPISVLFEDDFSNGLSPNWTVLSGEPLVVNHSLTASTPTWLMIGDSSWKNYEITLKVQNNECWMYDGIGGDTRKAAVGVRATNSNNMVAYEWANCEQEMAFVKNGAWEVIPNAIVNDESFSIMRNIKITVEGNQITVVVDNIERASITSTKSPSGGVVLIIPENGIVDDFKIVSLP